MKVILTVDWTELSIGLNITWGSRIAFGFGPVLLGIYWGPMYWRYLCPDCGAKFWTHAPNKPLPADSSPKSPAGE